MGGCDLTSSVRCWRVGYDVTIVCCPNVGVASVPLPAVLHVWPYGGCAVTRGCMCEYAFVAGVFGVVGSTNIYLVVFPYCSFRLIC